jgi:hypothetical protein
LEKLIKVGNYNKKFNELLGINITQEEIFRSKGLKTHLIKRNHCNCLKYIDCISDIIEHPDYIGINPNETNQSIELVKKYNDNILLGIKVDLSTNSLYISTMFDLQESKLQRRIHSGRLVKYE